MSGAQVAVIGGSGFYQMAGLSEIEELRIETPFGATSDAIVVGALEGTRVAFLPRHGAGHRLLPSEVPARANIWALKQLGVERIISVSAVGSLREEIAPLHLVVPDQLIDRTQGRPSTFFGRGLVVHIGFDQPFCPALGELLVGGGLDTGATVHAGGTSLVVEGPAFSTRAEAQIYRSWGADIIGMTALPEAKLAREAEVCYSTLALVTDYDTWNDSHPPVSVEMIVANLMENVDTAKRAIATVVRALPSAGECRCRSALSLSLLTLAEHVSDDVKRDLAPIIGRYMAVGTGAWDG